MGPEGIAPRASDDVQMENVPRPGHLGRMLDLRMVDLGSIPGSDRPPPFVPPVQVPQLDPQDGGLDLIEAAVETPDRVIVPLRLAVVAQHADPPRHLGIVGSDRAGVPVCTQVLGGIETPSSGIGEWADAAAPVR